MADIPFYRVQHRSMSTSRIRTKQIEQVRKLVHSDCLVGLNASKLIPVLSHADAITSDNGVGLPLGE